MDVYLEKLNINHTQMEFDSGDEDVNSFFERSLDEVLENNSKVYVLLTSSDLIGIFALSMSSIRAEIDGKLLKHPICLLCQLGINIPFQGQGYGSYLLRQAINIAMHISNDIGCKGIVVETYKKDLIESFYKNQGFLLIDSITQRDGSIKYILLSKFESFDV